MMIKISRSLMSSFDCISIVDECWVARGDIVLRMHDIATWASFTRLLSLSACYWSLCSLNRPNNVMKELFTEVRPAGRSGGEVVD